MATPKATDVKKGISLLWETLQCPICLELMTAPVSTNCDHQFCKFCMMKLLDNSKQNKACCPVCKAKITKRSLQESPGFQRLVAGLQDMIQAYERDTGTNYFTGQTCPFKDSNDMQAEAGHDQSSVDTRDTDLNTEKYTDHDILPPSHSSTTAAQNGFARLMGFENSFLSATENEGLDSGLGDAPPTSDKRMFSPARDPEPVQSDVLLGVKEATSTHKAGFVECPFLSSVPDESEHDSPGKWLKKKCKKSKIPQQRKKKSLEKVAEWLMKVPTDGTIELEELERNGHDSDSCSSASTIDLKQHMNDMILKRDGQAKPLEEQVFGAIYKRRSNKITPAPPNSLAKPSRNTETQAESASVVSNENPRSPADTTRQEQHEAAEATNDVSSGFFKEAGVESDTSVEESNKPGSDGNKDKWESVSGAKPRKRTRRAMQQLDSDLKEQICAESEGPDQKKPGKRKGKISKSDKSKPGRVQKPLVLVGVQKGERSPEGLMPRARAEEAQLQIESYSSSEGQEATVTRSTRKSRGLQISVEEVRGWPKKASLRARACGTNSVGKQHEKVESEAVGDKTQLSHGKMTGATRINGCVYYEDVADIENVSKPAAANKGSVGMISNADPPPDSPARSLSVVPNSASTNDADAVEPTFPNHKATDDSPTNARLVTLVCENEEEQNDCEADTEQLLKSFKATKRKSFHLGGADVKRSRYPDEDEEILRDFSGESATPSGTKQEFLKDTGKSTCDLISPSFSHIQIKKSVSAEADQVAVDSLIPGRSFPVPGISPADCTDSQSSALPPNQVAKSGPESPCVSVVPKVVSSGLDFTVVEHGDVNLTSNCSSVAESQRSCKATDDGKVKQRSDGNSAGDSSAQHSVNSAEHMSSAEFSLTPEGLMPPGVQSVHEAENSTSSSILGRKRSKRRPQTLESSSGSDSSGSKEDLPSLAHIFGIAACPPTGCQDLGKEDAGDAAMEAEVLNHLSRCSSPDCVSPSQGSVDLFGTPDECEVPVHNVEVSMESSQFSSEVLVTQQKVEMQKELVRLEKLMALVSEVLQEKEGSPSKDVPSQSRQWNKDAEVERGPPCSQDAGSVSDRKDVCEADGVSHPGPSGVRRVADPAPSKMDDITERVPHNQASVKGTKTLHSTSAFKSQSSSASPSQGQENKENSSPPKDEPKSKLVLVSSGLGPGEQVAVKRFANAVGARMVSRVTPEVTHVVIGTDEQLVCERTLKYFLGIAGRKWVVSFQWISECFKQKKLLDESLFEVRGDVVNGANHQGPSRARCTEDRDLLMKGYKICFQGSFTDMTTGDLEWMAELCGADVVKDPLLFDGKQKSHQLVVVQYRLESLASRSHVSRHATVVTRGWLLDSVSTYSLQNIDNYAT